MFLQQTKVHQSDEPQFTKKLLTLLGYRHVKLVASQKHRFAGALIASKHPFTILPASPVELGRVIAVRVEGVTLVSAYAPNLGSREQRMSAWVQTLPERAAHCRRRHQRSRQLLKIHPSEDVL